MTTTLHTRFTQAYHLSTPIAQAGMGFVGGRPELAVAVSDAGALGSIGVGLADPATLAKTIAETQGRTAKPFHVNFITLFAEQAGIDTVRDAGVAAASFHFGHPSKAWIDQLHASGVRVFEQVGTVDAAKLAADDGVDVIVAQGLEAGGHTLATLPTFAFVPLVVDAVAPALVLASGGIADGRGLAAALMLGADGVWVGTRFVATAEADAHDIYKAHIVKAGATDTAVTHIFGPEFPQFNPTRSVRNQVVVDWEGRQDQIPTDTSNLPIIGHTTVNGQPTDMHEFSFLLPTRDTTGDLEQMALLAGESAGLVYGIEPAAQVVESMTAGARAALDHYCGA